MRQDDTISPQVKLIYETGLKYLAESQNESGCWDDITGKEPGVVGLCVAAFLAHGEEPNSGSYAPVIRKGIDYILTQQNPQTGYIGDSMYNHAFATKALAEAYGMLDHPGIALALKKAIDLILSSQNQNRHGAWRYSPDSQDADTTITGCQVVSLFAAKNAGLGIPDEAIQKALKYMASCRAENGAYGYSSPTTPRPTLTAIGILCSSLAKEKDTKSFQLSLGYLKQNLDFRDKQYPYYYEYYMSQALFHADLELWQQWNQNNTRYLGTIQSFDGSFPGNNGAAFSTAGALLSLALNYRYLPIYEK